MLILFYLALWSPHFGKRELFALLVFYLYVTFEPRHVKTNKVTVHTVWSKSSLSTWKKLGSLAIHWAHTEDSAKADLSLRWVHSHFVGFDMSRLIVCFTFWCCGRAVILNLDILWRSVHDIKSFDPRGGFLITSNVNSLQELVGR